MCDETVPCKCTRDTRVILRAQHVQRQDALRSMWWRLRSAEQLSEAEDDLLLQKVEEEWDDAIHIASPDDPLRSLCGRYGRNLADLPDRPGGSEGCWTCLHKADDLAKAEQRELVTA
jgi:hypothetical protein